MCSGTRKVSHSDVRAADRAAGPAGGPGWTAKTTGGSYYPLAARSVAGPAGPAHMARTSTRGLRCPIRGFVGAPVVKRCVPHANACASLGVTAADADRTRAVPFLPQGRSRRWGTGHWRGRGAGLSCSPGAVGGGRRAGMFVASATKGMHHTRGGTFFFIPASRPPKGGVRKGGVIGGPRPSLARGTNRGFPTSVSARG
eukprot:gene16743-biopygen9812